MRIRTIRVIRGSLLPCSTLALFLALVAAAPATPADKPSAAKPPPRVEKNTFGPIELTLIADPPAVELQRDLLLTVKVTAPQEITVLLPPVDDRLKGFVLSGTLDRGVTPAGGGKVTVERQFLLTPVVSDEYRLAPMAITYTDRSKDPPASGWFATRPVVLERAAPISGKPGIDIKVSLAPVWVYPTFKTVAMWVLLVALAAAAAVALWKLGRKVQRQVRLMRMSPRERALHELAELIARNLIGQNLIKEFYLALTLIVRRYIERAHKVRAPEQTTEEFLAAVSRDRRFSREVVEKLKAFLQAADLVKFAAHRPKEDEITRATGTAREYIETDAAGAAEAAEARTRNGQT